MPAVKNDLPKMTNPNNSGIEKLKKAHSDNPNDPKILYNLAMEMRKGARFFEVVKYLTAALDLFDGSPTKSEFAINCHFERIYACIQLPNTGDIIHSAKDDLIVLREAKCHEPSSPHYIKYINLKTRYDIAKGTFDECENALNKTVMKLEDYRKKYPGEASLFRNSGLAYLWQGEIDQAEKMFEGARKLSDYDDARDFYNLALLQSTLQNYEISRNILSEGIKEFPHDASLFTLFGNTFFGEGRIPEAIECYQHACRLNEYDWQQRLEVAELYFLYEDNKKEAKKFYRASRSSLRKTDKNASFESSINKRLAALKQLEKSCSGNAEKAHRLMTDSTMREIEKIYWNKHTFSKYPFLRSDSAPPVTGFRFKCLQQWNSFTPVMSSDEFNRKGGGYFFQHNGKGIVIDPGYNFIENFHSAGHRFNEIDYIFITHDHDDHTANLEPIISLLYRYNRNVKGHFHSLFHQNDTFAYRQRLERGNDLRKIEEASGSEEMSEKVIDSEFEKSDTKKRISFYLTKSTFKKYSTLLNLGSKKDYEVTIIDENSSFNISEFGDVICVPAKHKTLLSDNDAIGFCLLPKDENYAFIYTGDTGFSEKIKSSYEAILKKSTMQNRRIVLLAHIGGFEDREKEYGGTEVTTTSKITEIAETAYYKNHLGRLGLIEIVDVLNSNDQLELCIVSEFGEELGGVRSILCKLFCTIFDNKVNFLHADIGLDLKIEKNECKIWAYRHCDQSEARKERKRVKMTRSKKSNSLREDYVTQSAISSYEAGTDLQGYRTYYHHSSVSNKELEKHIWKP